MITHMTLMLTVNTVWSAFTLHAPPPIGYRSSKSYTTYVYKVVHDTTLFSKGACEIWDDSLMIIFDQSLFGANSSSTHTSAVIMGTKFSTGT